MEANYSFGTHESGRGLAAVLAEVRNRTFASLSREHAAIKNRHERAASGKLLLYFHNARVCRFDALRRVSGKVPACDIEKAETLNSDQIMEQLDISNPDEATDPAAAAAGDAKEGEMPNPAAGAAQEDDPMKAMLEANEKDAKKP